MAALVSHAMHRLPTSPLDASYSSYGLRCEGSSRHGGDGTGRSGSTGALSRSMRYADPWLYGSVRGTGGLLLGPALVLCTCSEYVTGSRRSSSKKAPHLCKKCKGTRLPLSPVDSKFGTVRCYPTSLPLSTTSPLRAGTVRVTSSSRPSILPSPDPYDLMRRSRLSVPESTNTQFRDITSSPSKNKDQDNRNQNSTKSKGLKKETSYNSTVGRRSILECDINPYELMSTEKPTVPKESITKDSKSKEQKSVALVNGQRIRISPDYEDVQGYKITQTTKSSAVHCSASTKSNKNKSSVSLVSLPHKNKPIEKEPDYSNTFNNNQFKSILKKRGSSFSNADSSSSPDVEEAISPLANRKNGSQFYIPMPFPLTVRKKVQFLDASESDSSHDGEKEKQEGKAVVENKQGGDKEDDVYDDVFEDALEEVPIMEVKHEKQTDIPVRTSKLYRSNSERITNDHKNVDFFDTMALRNKRRTDARITFSNEDLEKLDGITSRTRKISPRPKTPPPPPPIQSDIEQKNKKNDLKPLVKDQKNTYVTNKLNIPTKDEGLDAIKHINNINTIDQVSYNDHFVNNVGVTTEQKLHKFTESDENYYKHNISISSNKVALHDNDYEQRNSKKINTGNNFHDTNMAIYQDIPLNNIGDTYKDSSDISSPPSAPPRKRSNNKQPVINIIKHPDIQSVKIESPIPEKSNKTIVQISSPHAVHKIQIKNEFPESANIKTIPVFENPQRKTSILINGDDCYSTVNVNDNVPLYHSSVVVKDDFSSSVAPKKNSSKIYITGTFITSDTDKVLSEVSEHLSKLSTEKDNNVPEKEVAKEFDVPDSMNNTAIKHNSAELNPEHSKSDVLILKEKKPNQVISLDSSSSSELLSEILRDPVEAVRHNLVPHVCGKSDMSRRPRDTKFPNHTSLPIKSDSLFKSPLEDTNISSSLEDSFLRLRNYESIGDDVSSEHSSSTQYELMDQGSECYTDHSNRSSVTEEELANRTKFYELLAEGENIEVSESEDHHYESIKVNNDPIYEEIEIPPPLPTNPPPSCILDDLQLDKEYTTRSIFEGASKYDILSYLVDAKERVQEDGYSYNFNSNSNTEDESKERYNRVSHMSTVSDSSEDNSLIISGALIDEKATFQKPAEVERNDSGVGSETSKSSLSKYRTKQEVFISCEDCDSALEYKAESEPLLCRKCIKKRSERKEIITEIVETEEKYSKDLQIILEEFYQPMLVAGLLTSDQLAAIFLNAEELLENSQALAERLRDAVEIALEQGDDDLLTVNIGKLFLEAAPMLHGFETYCIRQGTASLLLASLEKEKELLRIFLRVSQMENTMLRRMNLNSFLMVPVQRVTKYPLLLARLYKVTTSHHETREHLKEAQHKIELHLNHMNSETKDVPSKLWRRIGSSSGRRPSTEMDLVNIKLRKIAVDVLEWNHEEARFILEGKLLFTQPTDNNWRKGRTIKLTPVNALLVVNGKQASVSKPSTDKLDDNGLVFSRNSGVREAALLLVRDKNGRYSLLREPLYLDRCVIAADPAWQSYFEVQELLGKDTFIFKADGEDQTNLWYKKLQYYAQGMGAWRKRRNALANIMINGMGLRS